MIIPSSTLDSAMRRVFQRVEAEPGLAVHYSAISEEWTRLGLRPGDLRDAMRELVDKGYAAVQQKQGDLAFELTIEGYSQFYHRKEITH